MSSRPDIRPFDRTTPPHVLTLVCVAGLSAMAMNIFLPSLPRMAAHFGVDYGVMQLSVSLYLLMTAILHLFVGPISDRYGRRPVLLVSILLFLAATVGTIYAPTAESFLVFRMGQAVLASGMVLSRAIVRDLYEQSESASIIGYVTMGMAVVPMIAPAIGGVLDQYFGWTASFWLLLASGIALFLLVWFDLGETNKTQSSSFARQFADYPELLTARRFWGYCFCAAFSSGAYFAFLGGAPFLGSEVFDLSPTTLGIYIGAPAVGYAFGNFLAGRYSVRFGTDRMVLFGTIFTAAGMALSPAFYALGATHPAVFFGFVTTVGLGNGIALPNANAGMLSVRPHLAGTASGLGGAIMIGGGALLSAMAGAVLKEGTGPYPLQMMMLVTSALAVVSILYVIQRDKKIGVGEA